MRLLHPAFLSVAGVAVCLSFAACGGGDSGGSSSTTPAPAPATPDPDAASDDPNADVDTGDNGDVGPLADAFIPPAEDASVVYRGLGAVDDGGVFSYLTYSEGLFCARPNLQVVVQASGIGDRQLRLYANTRFDLNGDGIQDDVRARLPVEAVPLTGPNISEPDLYVFPLNADTLVRPPEDSEQGASDGQVLVADEQFDLRVEAWTPNQEGTDYVAPGEETLFDEVNLKTDAAPPTITLTNPDPAFELPTLSGFASFEGRIEDTDQVSHVAVTWGGLDEGETPKLLTTQYAPTDAVKLFDFNSTADLRYEPSEYDRLTVTGYDACGLSSSIEVNLYLLAWSWIRTTPRFTLPDNQVINDTLVTLWDGDEYPDVLIATEKGIWVAINKGGYPLPEDADFTAAAAKVEFSQYVQLTSARALAIDTTDLDNDGDQDIIAAARIAIGGTDFAVYRNRGVGTDSPDGIPSVAQVPEEYAPLPIANATKVRGIKAADFDADGLVDVVIGTDSQEQTLLLFKRLTPDSELGGTECAAVEFDEPTASQAQCDAEAEEAAAEGEEPAALIPACGGGCVEDQRDDGQCQVALNCSTHEYDLGDCCPQLFASQPAFAGGIDGLVKFEIADVTEVGSAEDDLVEGQGDGYPDIIVSAEGANQVWVFPNRFSQTGLLDTAFTSAEGSWVWTVTGGNQGTDYFCLADMVKASAMSASGGWGDGFTEDDDFVDIVVGTAGNTGGTFRTLVGKGDGTFYNERPLSGPYSGLDIRSMSGTIGTGINGIVCADFDQDPDGNMDFMAISSGTRLLQVHLGDGKGRYNQLPESPLLNPANEAIGFTIDAQAQRPRAADFNLDGYPDLLVDYRNSAFSVMTNLTYQGEGFDLDGTQALVTPLGKTSVANNGNLETMAVGDLTGDQIPDVVAMGGNSTFKAATWLVGHPVASSYRQFLCAGGPCSSNNDCSAGGSGTCDVQLGACTGAAVSCDKKKAGSTVFVWSSELGTRGPSLPSYPAAYDRAPPVLFGQITENADATEPAELRLIDLSGSSDVSYVEPDGRLDLVFTGKSEGSAPQSNFAALLNVATDGFWDIDSLYERENRTFVPFNGSSLASSSPTTFAFFTPPGHEVPGIVVPTNMGLTQQCSEPSPYLQFCPWNDQRKEGEGDDQVVRPFWDCHLPQKCQHQAGMKYGGLATEVIKLSVEEETLGLQSHDPMTPGDVLVVSAGGDNLSLFTYNPELSVGDNEVDGFWPALVNDVNDQWYWDEPRNLAVGLSPQDVTVGNIDGEGLPDIAATVQKNVMLAYGDVDNPYESFLPVDKRPGFLQEGGVSHVELADMNDDSFTDIIFTETSQARVTIYLAIGSDPSAEANGETPSFLRQYHGPLHIPVCKSPTQLEVVDFDGDGLCPTIVVLCEASGAIAMVANDTCRQKAESANAASN